mmetsp:Transcript_15810/g.49967  ORF Transcript_15810/g.49967 Transcript_15810/m.49967 type:complete len:271 (-) Transcript_15810:178-990(-)
MPVLVRRRGGPRCMPVLVGGGGVRVVGGGGDGRGVGVGGDVSQRLDEQVDIALRGAQAEGEGQVPQLGQLAVHTVPLDERLVEVETRPGVVAKHNHAQRVCLHPAAGRAPPWRREDTHGWQLREAAARLLRQCYGGGRVPARVRVRILPPRGVEGGQQQVRWAAALHQLERPRDGAVRQRAVGGDVKHCSLRHRAERLVAALNDEVGAARQGGARQPRCHPQVRAVRLVDDEGHAGGAAEPARGLHVGKHPVVGWRDEEHRRDLAAVPLE